MGVKACSSANVRWSAAVAVDEALCLVRDPLEVLAHLVGRSVDDEVLDVLEAVLVAAGFGARDDKTGVLAEIHEVSHILSRLLSLRHPGQIPARPGMAYAQS